MHAAGTPVNPTEAQLTGNFDKESLIGAHALVVPRITAPKPQSSRPVAQAGLSLGRPQPRLAYVSGRPRPEPPPPGPRSA